MNVITELYRAAAILRDADESYTDVPPSVFAAIDAAVDICEKADALVTAVTLGCKDVDYAGGDTHEDVGKDFLR